MNEFDLVVETFVSMLESYSGSNPVFQIDFHGKRIIVKEASSGFIKAMVNYPGSLVTLRGDGLSFQIINYGKEN